MSKITYTSLKLKRDNSTKICHFADHDIEVLQYLPFDNKYDLINIAMQNSKVDQLYDPMKVDMYFHLYLVMLYTNITFTEKQREDEVKLYDALKSTGLIDEIISLIPEDEYNSLLEYLDQEIQDQTKYAMSMGAALTGFMTQMPIDAEAVSQIVDNFDPQQYQAVLDFAEAANGGRPLPNNK